MHPHPADSGLGIHVPVSILQQVHTYCGMAKLQERNRSSPRLQSAECRSPSIVALASTSRLPASRMFAQISTQYTLHSSKKWQMQCNAAFLEAALARLNLLHQALSHWRRLGSGEGLAVANCMRKARLEEKKKKTNLELGTSHWTHCGQGL